MKNSRKGLLIMFIAIIYFAVGIATMAQAQSSMTVGDKFLPSEHVSQLVVAKAKKINVVESSASTLQVEVKITSTNMKPIVLETMKVSGMFDIKFYELENGVAVMTLPNIKDADKVFVKNVQAEVEVELTVYTPKQIKFVSKAEDREYYTMK